MLKIAFCRASRVLSFMSDPPCLVAGVVRRDKSPRPRDFPIPRARIDRAPPISRSPSLSTRGAGPLLRMPPRSGVPVRLREPLAVRETFIVAVGSCSMAERRISEGGGFAIEEADQLRPVSCHFSKRQRESAFTANSGTMNQRKKDIWKVPAFLCSLNTTQQNIEELREVRWLGRRCLML